MDNDPNIDALHELEFLRLENARLQAELEGLRGQLADQPLAERLFHHRRGFDVAECKFQEAMRRIVGRIVPREEDYRFDHHDDSFEVRGCTDLEFQFTSEQWEQLHALGFERAWIVYTNGTERSYPGGTLRERP